MFLDRFYKPILTILNWWMERFLKPLDHLSKCAEEFIISDLISAFNNTIAKQILTVFVFNPSHN